MCRIPVVSTTGALTEIDLLAICTKLREISGASAAYKSDNSIRAVAQLGRAPGSGRAAKKYPYFLSRALTCLFTGKLIEGTLSQVSSSDPKNIVGG
jgi:hypothetical protein